MSFTIKYALSKLKRKLLGQQLLSEENHNLIAESGQFDAEFYISQLTAHGKTLEGFDPIGHYLVKGAKAGLDPSLEFSSKDYIAETGLGPNANPLVQFIRHTTVVVKKSSGLDPAYYATHNPDVARAYVDMAWHFLTSGCREGRRPSAHMTAGALCAQLNWRIPRAGNTPVGVQGITKLMLEVVERELDAAYYIATYPDVIASGMTPAQHYVYHGWREGRNPIAWFKTNAYLTANPDIRTAGLNPFFHYITAGRAEGRQLAN